jgi:dUTP pyrophosphatase
MRKSRPTVRFKRLTHGADLPIPCYKSKEAAGMDLAAAVPAEALWRLFPKEQRPIPTGFHVAIPSGYVGLVNPRSGLAASHSVTIANAPGTIDADYRGEIMVMLINHGAQTLDIKRGDRIGQLVIVPVAYAEALEVAELDETERGARGFGSTGVAG